MTILQMIAWGSTLLAALFLVLMIIGVDDLFGGMFEARVVAFFGAGMGWGSIMMLDAGQSMPVALAVGVGVGLLLGLVSLSMVLLIRRASSVTEPAVSSPVGKAAEVVIPPDSSMSGMVRLVHRGQLEEMTAKFSSSAPAGSHVIVTGVLGGKLMVEPVLTPQGTTR